MSTSLQNSINTIEQFLATVGGSVKRAEANTEAGGYQRGTTHPVKDVDDRTEVAQEGERSTENDRDVKEDQGAVGVNSAAIAKSARDILSGLSRYAAMPTYNVKRSENTDGLKGNQHKLDMNGNGKLDGEDFKMMRKKRAESAVSTPGSAADDQLQIGTNKQPTGEDPSNETNSAKAGKKDSDSDHPARTDNDSLDGHKFSYDRYTSLEKLASYMNDIGNELVAQIAHVAWTAKKAEDESTHGYAYEKKETNKQAQQEHVDGELAQLVGYDLANVISDKQATDNMVHSVLSDIVKAASLKADLLAEYHLAHSAELRKQAEADMLQEAVAQGGGGAPPGGMGGMGGAPGGNEAEMLASLGGMGAEGQGGGDGGDEMAKAEQLIEALKQMGIPEEEIMALLQGGQGADAGADAGAGLPPAPSEKMSSARTQRALAKMAESYLTEVFSRSKKR
jgi:hypothetical protein